MQYAITTGLYYTVMKYVLQIIIILNGSIQICTQSKSVQICTLLKMEIIIQICTVLFISVQICTLHGVYKFVLSLRIISVQICTLLNGNIQICTVLFI